MGFNRTAWALASKGCRARDWLKLFLMKPGPNSACEHIYNQPTSVFPHNSRINIWENSSFFPLLYQENINFKIFKVFLIAPLFSLRPIPLIFHSKISINHQFCPPHTCQFFSCCNRSWKIWTFPSKERNSSQQWGSFLS